MLLVVVTVLIAVLANFGEREAAAAIGAYAIFVAAATFLGLTVATNLLSGVTYGAHPSPGNVAGAGVEVLGAFAACLALLRPVRRAAAAVLPLFRAESPVHAVALGFYLMILLFQAGSQIAVDQIAQTGQAGSPSVLYIIATNQLPMLVVAIAGVGLFVRRSPGQTLARLGLWWPGWRWIAGGLGFAVILLVIGVGFDELMAKLTPVQNREIQQVTDQLFKNASNLVGVAIIGLGAGIGEEIFFRGALQPRFGIIPAAVLFAALHTQYGISIATLEILVIGIVLGLLRKRAGTLTAIVAHSGYDILVGLLPLLLSK